MSPRKASVPKGAFIIRRFAHKALSYISASCWRQHVVWITYSPHSMLMNLPNCIGWKRCVTDAFSVEFNADKRLKHRLDVKFREHRQRLEDLFNPDTSGGDSIAAILRNRFMGLCEIKNALKDIVTDRTAQLDLLSSLSHMCINRIFTANQREHEMIIYHFLAKHYLSSIKRGVLKHREVPVL